MRTHLQRHPISHLLPVAAGISTLGRTKLSRIMDGREEERIQVGRFEAFVTDSAVVVGTVDDVRPVITFLYIAVSLYIMSFEGTALTPPDRDAIAAILHLD